MKIMKNRKTLIISGLSIITPLAFASLAISCGCNGEKANAYGVNLLSKHFKYDKGTKTSTLDLSNTNITHIKSGAFNGNFVARVAQQKDFPIKDLVPSENNPASLPKIDKLILPKSLEYIGKDAFSNLQIKEIDFNGNTSLKMIDINAFLGNKLTSLTLPNTNLEIKENAFAENELTTLNLDKTEKIAAGAFSKNKIAELTLPETLKDVSLNAFAPQDESIAKTKLIVKNTDLYTKLLEELNASTYKNKFEITNA